MKKTQPFVYDILSSQDKLIENLFILFLLAFGINLIANQIPIFFKIDPLFSIIFGIALILLTFLYFIRQIILRRHRHQKYKAFVIFNERENKIVNVPHYDFSYDQVSYLNAAFAENENLRKFWDSHPMDDFPSCDDKSVNNQKIIKLFNELTEYLVLRQMCFKLEAYFHNPDFRETEFKTYERDDIPEILSKNRFLEIMSLPPSERHLFDYRDESDESFGKIYYCNGKNGAIFDRFELILPKNCILKKPKDNIIVIESDKMTISIMCDFKGIGTNLPFDFEELFLKMDFSFLSAFQIQIILDADMKNISLFSKNGLEYYRWLDSFLEDLDEYLTQDTYFEKINWNTARTIIHCLMIKKKGLKNHNFLLFF
jgi:hypothetical protein